jgi:hypothetical protein
VVEPRRDADLLQEVLAPSDSPIDKDSAEEEEDGPVRSRRGVHPTASLDQSVLLWPGSDGERDRVEPALTRRRP